MKLLIAIMVVCMMTMFAPVSAFAENEQNSNSSIGYMNNTTDETEFADEESSAGKPAVAAGSNPADKNTITDENNAGKKKIGLKTVGAAGAAGALAIVAARNRKLLRKLIKLFR